MRKLTVSALVLALSSIFLVSSPAQAHNELIGESPNADSVVEAGTFDIRLDFDAEPIPTEFGKGNLIAIANSVGEQLGAACARIEGKSMYTTVSIDEPGTYKILWRSASSDGHIADGDYLITVENNSGYVSEQVGNQCFGDNGVELKPDSTVGFVQGLIWGGAFIAAGGVLGAYLVMRRKPKK
jgi:methionine-rich copper-binding protein CopC